MKCVKCGAEVEKSFTTDIFDLGDCVLIIRNIPCFKCTKCTETIYTGKIIRSLEKIIEQSKKNIGEISVIDFSKIAA